jgi:hypothetical protein
VTFDEQTNTLTLEATVDEESEEESAPRSMTLTAAEEGAYTLRMLRAASGELADTMSFAVMAATLDDYVTVTDFKIFKADGVTEAAQTDVDPNTIDFHEFCRFGIDWSLTLPSGTIAVGDTVTIQLPSSANGFVFMGTSPVDLLDSNNDPIGTWQIIGGKAVITFDSHVTGKNLTSVSGVLDTGKNPRNDVTAAGPQNVTVGDKTKQYYFTGYDTWRPTGTARVAKTMDSAGNNRITWTMHCFWPLQNFAYNNLQGVPSQTATLIEDTLDGAASVAGVRINAPLLMPAYETPGTYAISGNAATHLAMNSHFTLVTQTGGESYAMFKARVASSPRQYGVYTEADGTIRFVGYIGDIPGDGLTYEGLSSTPNLGDYAKANVGIGYTHFMTDARAALMNDIYSSTNAAGGRILAYRFTIAATYAPTLVPKGISNTATMTYDGGSTASGTSTGTLSPTAGTATAGPAQSAKLVKYDYDDQQPTGLLAGASFKL